MAASTRRPTRASASSERIAAGKAYSEESKEAKVGETTRVNDGWATPHSSPSRYTKTH